MNTDTNVVGKVYILWKQDDFLHRRMTSDGLLVPIYLLISLLFLALFLNVLNASQELLMRL